MEQEEGLPALRRRWSQPRKSHRMPEGKEAAGDVVFESSLHKLEGFDEAMRPLLPAFSQIKSTEDFWDMDGISTFLSYVTEANREWSERMKVGGSVPDIMAGLEARVRDMGNTTFATWIESGDREGASYTFRQMWDAAGAVAYSLVHKWGAAPGDRVLLCYNFGFEYAFAFLGCLRAGCIACPVYPIDPLKFTASLTTLSAAVKHTGAKICLTHKLMNRVRIFASFSGYNNLIPQGVDWRTTDHLSTPRYWGTHGTYDYPGRQQTDVAFIQYTSGSTGEAKPVAISYQQLGANVGLIAGAQKTTLHYFSYLPRNQHFHMQTTERSTSVSWVPMIHDMGLVYGLVCQFYQGARMYYMSPVTFLKDPCSWVRLLAKYRCNWAAGPDFAYRMCAKKWDSSKWKPQDYRLDTLVYAHTSAEPIRESTLDDFYRVFRPHGLHPRAVTPVYGLAESTVCVSWVDAIALPRSAMFSKARPGYMCAAGQMKADIRIVNPDTCEEVADGAEGEIWVSSASVGAGYWEMPEASKEVFGASLRHGLPRPWEKYGLGNHTYLRSGDMGFLEDGKLFFLGRMKDMVVLNGKHYYAQDIEFPAERVWPAIRGGRVAALAMEEGTKLAVVFELAPRKYTPPVLEKKFHEVAQAITQSTGLVPWRLVAIKDRTIPRTTNGKVRRQAAREALLRDGLQVICDSCGPFSTDRPSASVTMGKPTSAAAPNEDEEEEEEEEEPVQSTTTRESGGYMTRLYSLVADVADPSRKTARASDVTMGGGSKPQ